MFDRPIRILLAAVSIAIVWNPAGRNPAVLAAPPSDQLLPNTVAGYVSVPNVEQLVQSWNKTQLGRLLDDPVMKPFGEDLRRQVREKWLQSNSRLGLSVEDLQGLASGELCLAIIKNEERRAAVAVLVDVTGNEERATEQLQRVADGLLKRGFKRSQQVEDGTTLTLFDRAADEDARTPALSAVFCIKQGVLLASDDLQTVKGILNRFSGDEPESLAAVTAYQAVNDRCRQGATGLNPHLRWFIDPFALAESIRSWKDTRRRGGINYAEGLKNQGFAAIQGVGGFLNFAERPYGVVHRTCVFAPGPYKLAMRMLVFPNQEDFTPQPWVSRDLATYVTFRMDLLNAFDHVDTLLDEIVFEGEKGAWADTLESIRTDEYGPKLDLRADLVAHLGQRVTVLTDYKLPITPTSQRRLVAIELKDSEAMGKSVQKSVEGDPRFKGRKINGYPVWEFLPEEHPVPDLAVERPGLSDDLEFNLEEPEPAVGGGPAVKPNSAISVAMDHLFIASNIELLTKVLSEVEPRERLERDVDYRLIQAELARLVGGEHCAEGFARTDEQYRASYEMFRQGKLPEMDTFFAQFLNAVLGEDKEGLVRKPQLDASKLPDYEVVRRYLGPAGSYVSSEENGWFIVGFTLSKDSPLANEAGAATTTSR